MASVSEKAQDVTDREIIESVVSCKYLNEEFFDRSYREWRRQIFASNDPYRVVEIVNEISSLEFDSSPIRYLEIGVGYGYVTKPVLEHFGDYITASVLEHPGVDRVHSEPFQEFFAEHEVELHQQDLSTGIEIDESYDIIVISEVTEHLSPTVFADLVHDLRSICDGYLLVTTPNITNVTNRRRLLFGQDLLATPVVREGDASYDHIYLYSMSTLCELLKVSDYRIETQRHLSAWPEKTRRAILERDPVKAAYNLVESAIQHAFPRCRKRLLVVASA